MTKECLWYNGETSSYELLDFNPNGLTKEQIIECAKELLLERYSFSSEELNKLLDTLYLIDINNLESLK